MGNQSSSDFGFGGSDSNQQEGHPSGSQQRSSGSNGHHNTPLPIRNLLNRTTGAAGFTKAELDKKCQPSGLYPSCGWDDKAIRRLIADGKIAPRQKGNENRIKNTDCECPICFFFYTEINSTKCCQAYLCTECYLQVKPQRESKSKPSSCPFCNSSKLSVSIAKKMEASAVKERDKEEKLVEEAKMRARSADSEKQKTAAANSDTSSPPSSAPSSAAATTATAGSNDDTTPPVAPAHSFGSSLEQQNHRVAILRARSSSMNSSSHTDDPPEVSVNEIAALAMTPEEREAIEQEMKAQHNHPLAQRLQAEEEERRLQNEREYYRSQAGRLRELRARRELLSRTLGGGVGSNGDPVFTFSGGSGISRGANNHDLNRLMEAFENNIANGRAGSGGAQSLDDLVVLEAAIMLSMEEEARRRAVAANGNEDQAGGAESGNESTGGGAAASASSANASSRFPVTRDRVTQLLRSTSSSSANSSDNNSNNNNHIGGLLLSHGGHQSRDSRSRRGRGGRNYHHQFAGAGHNPLNIFAAAANSVANDTTLDTAAMLMRGISEEEQIAMAIAASLQDSAPPPSGGNNSENGDGENNNDADDNGNSQNQNARGQNSNENRSNNDDGRAGGSDNDGENGNVRGSQVLLGPALLQSFSSEFNSSRRAMVDAMNSSRRAMEQVVQSTRRAMNTESSPLASSFSSAAAAAAATSTNLLRGVNAGSTSSTRGSSNFTPVAHEASTTAETLNTSENNIQQNNSSEDSPAETSANHQVGTSAPDLVSEQEQVRVNADEGAQIQSENTERDALSPETPIVTTSERASTPTQAPEVSSANEVQAQVHCVSPLIDSSSTFSTKVETTDGSSDKISGYDEDNNNVV